MNVHPVKAGPIPGGAPERLQRVASSSSPGTFTAPPGVPEAPRWHHENAIAGAPRADPHLCLAEPESVSGSNPLSSAQIPVLDRCQEKEGRRAHSSGLRSLVAHQLGREHRVATIERGPTASSLGTSVMSRETYVQPSPRAALCTTAEASLRLDGADPMSIMFLPCATVQNARASDESPLRRRH